MALDLVLRFKFVIPGGKFFLTTVFDDNYCSCHFKDPQKKIFGA